MTDFFKTHWAQLNDRERAAVVIGGVVCAIYLFYLLVLAPLMHAVHDKLQMLIEKKETLSWMQQVAPSPASKMSPKKITSSKLLTLLTEDLNKSALEHFPYQLQQTSVTDIQLIFEKVPYNLWIQWFWSFSEAYAISLKKLTIERQSVPGMIKLTVVLRVYTHST